MTTQIYFLLKLPYALQQMLIKNFIQNEPSVPKFY